MLKATDGKYTIQIHEDMYPTDPREDYDHLGKMACWHRRYSLGDFRPNEDPSDFYKQMKQENCIFLPLYLFDHSGLTMSTAGFADPWDSGQVGWIYIPAKRVREEYGWKRITKARRQKIEEYLKAEVNEYDEYLRGEVYYAEIYEGEELIDCCGGFYGDAGIDAALEGLPTDANITRSMLEWVND